MKTILRTSILLLLIITLGVSIPKFVNSRVIDSSGVEDQTPSVEKADSPYFSKENSISSLENKTSIPEIPSEFLEIIDEIDIIIPLKSETIENAVEVESKIESEQQKEQGNNNDSNIDNTTSTVPTSESITPALSEPKEIESPAEINASYDQYVKSSLNVRTGPSISYPKIATLKAGEKVHVTKVVLNGWSYIEGNGIAGYVSSSYLSKTTPVKEAPQKLAPSQPVPPITKPLPDPTPTPAPPKEEPTKPAVPSDDPYRMIIGGKRISYENGGVSKGQSIIDGNSDLISTWGGAETYSGTDGHNTHFIGHNPGVFSVLLKVSMGSPIIVTDGNGAATTYSVTNIFTVDDNAYNKKDQENYYTYIASKQGGEVITLQTCLSSEENLIIRAVKR